MDATSDVPQTMPTLDTAYQAAILIKSLRTFFRMSQTELAKLSRVSRPTIDRIESLRGIEQARPETLEQLLDVFRMLGVVLDMDPARGAQVSFTLTAMTLSVEKLTEEPELRERLSLFEAGPEERSSRFDRLLGQAARRNSPLMERYRGQPFPDTE